MSDNNSTGKKVGKSFLSMFKRLFVRDKIEKNILEEEAMRTPMKAVMHRFIRNKMAIIGFSLFVAIFLFSFVGSLLNPLDRALDLTNTNIRPSRNFLRYPRELADLNIVKIISGVSFSAALTDDGNIHVWGAEPNREMEGISQFMLQVPEEIQEAHIVDIAAGTRFILAVDDEGNFYGWGHVAHGQAEITSDMRRMMSINRTEKIVQVLAGTTWAAVLGDNGFLYLWGSIQATSTFVIPTAAQGRIVYVAAGHHNMILLLDDGTVMPMGDRGTEFFLNVPPELQDGSVRIVEVAVTNRNVLARDDTGQLHLWGSVIDGLNSFPEDMVPDNVVDIASAYNNFVAVKDTGEVFVWGSNTLGQLNLPRNINQAGVTQVFADAFQFYAVNADGDIVETWGNRGYIFGSDQWGRDIFTRIMHGGRVSLTVGIIGVIIATLIAIIIGLSSGYFGGWLDHALMRLADIFDAIPFLPLAITLSFVLGDNLNEAERMYFIMIVLGVLSWTGLARLIRAQLLLEREKDFVLAAKALGIKQRSIMTKHILPHVFNFVIVSVTLQYASFILTEAALSFLGFGIQEPTPSWGNMLDGAQDSIVLRYFWWRWIIPALFVVAAALSINMIGDALRDAMDPKAEER
ncbi:MAG: ABC transporter permease subunit [Oscillospiraceae bacterium]|nr:ABC transporter permease subunit [Oscillospiraceae bacterium]MCL2278732.1 ABC transporter permease subunit [Oscillospiraceae bacterium]